jgi:hypothetical protein
MTLVYLLIFVDLHTDLVNFGSIKNILMTCTRTSRHPGLTNALQQLILRRRVFPVFMKYWLLRTATKFAVCPPQIILLSDLQNILPTWSFVSQTVHGIYSTELLRDPHAGHPMRAIRHTGGMFIFPQWMDTYQEPGSLYQSSTIIQGRHTWWQSWPFDPFSLWPLALSEQDIAELLSNNVNMQISSTTEWVNAALWHEAYRSSLRTENVYMSHRPNPRVLVHPAGIRYRAVTRRQL